MKGLHLSLCILLPLVSGNAFAATTDSPAVPEAAAPSPACQAAFKALRTTFGDAAGTFNSARAASLG